MLYIHKIANEKERITGYYELESKMHYAIKGKVINKGKKIVENKVCNVYYLKLGVDPSEDVLIQFVTVKDLKLKVNDYLEAECTVYRKDMQLGADYIVTITLLSDDLDTVNEIDSRLVDKYFR